MTHNTIASLSIGLSLFLILFGFQLWTAIGLSYCIYISLEFIRRMGNEIPIPHMMLLIASMQWILGPWIDYITPETHYLYHMYVSEDVYMSYVVPCIIAMHIGIQVFAKNISLNTIGANANAIIEKHKSIPYILILGGFAMPFIAPYMPTQLAFVFYLLTNIKYIGAIYLMFSNNKNRWFVFTGIMLITLTTSMAAGMFHDFLLWGILSFTFISHEFKLNFISKFTFLVIGAFLIITIQAIKPKVRDFTKNGYVGNELALFFALSVEEWQSGRITTPTNQNELNVRLNQGWIISRIMLHVPKKEPFANGSTITEAISATLLPRFLSPDKAISGGRKNFMRYSGLELNKGTSMGISLAGEGWANFGYYGGIIFMLGWGLFVGWFWRFINTKTAIYPTLLIWSPLIFQQVIKAETELLDVLNHLVKAAILVFIILWIIKKQWRISL